ncbi:MAG: hypothetical protein KJ731_04065, partial [Alphaproteobacteria bacterium]|nr:hypothetical protein [Alphaproteobacteria bacterium]MBU1827642.1 hypothetical protein [Alphaproteobacteria bacterium]
RYLLIVFALAGDSTTTTGMDCPSGYGLLALWRRKMGSAMTDCQCGIYGFFAPRQGRFTHHAA